MSVPLTVNGVTFNYPVQGDVRWGPVLTAWSTAVTTGMLQKAGGSFPLTAEVDFGSSFGINVLSLKSTTLPRAASGFMRLANAQTISWRNAGNSGDLPLTVDASNQLLFNGVPIGASASLTDSHIFVGNASNQPADVAMSGDITISNTGVTAIGGGVIVNADVNASAAIAVSKLAAQTASRAAAFDGSGFLTPSATTSTQLGYLSTTTSDVQTQIDNIVADQGDYLPLAGGTMSGLINMASNKIISLANGTAAGDGANFGQLRILQLPVFSTESTGGTTTSASFVAMGAQASITPSSLGSRIIILGGGTVQSGTNTGGIVALGVAQNGSALFSAGTSPFRYLNSTAANVAIPMTLFYVDTPGTLSSVTYQLMLASNGTSTAAIGGAIAGSQNTYIMLLEIL